MQVMQTSGIQICIHLICLDLHIFNAVMEKLLVLSNCPANIYKVGNYEQ